MHHTQRTRVLLSKKLQQRWGKRSRRPRKGITSVCKNFVSCNGFVLQQCASCNLNFSNPFASPITRSLKIAISSSQLKQTFGICKSSATAEESLFQQQRRCGTRFLASKTPRLTFQVCFKKEWGRRHSVRIWSRYTSFWTPVLVKILVLKFQLYRFFLTCCLM